MRILTQCLAMLSSAALLAGCVNEEPNYAKKPDSGNGTPTEVGYLSLSGLEMKVIYDGETETMPDDTADASATRAATPQVDDFICARTSAGRSRSCPNPIVRRLK